VSVRLPGWSFALGGALAALVYLPAAAAPSSIAVVLYGPDDPDPARLQRAVAAYNLQAETRRAAPSVRHVGTAFGAVAELEVHGAGGTLTCEGAGVTAEALATELDAALDDVFYVRIEEAEDRLERLDAQLPCLSAVLPREQLARIPFLQGVALAYGGDHVAAREAYRRALVVSPDLEWDARFPPGAEVYFGRAFQDALRSETATLAVAPRVGTEGTLWVDGEEFPEDGGEATLAVGRHLLQWTLEQGAFASMVVDVTGGERITVFRRADVQDAAVRGLGLGPALVRAAEALQQLATDAGVDEIHLAELGAADLLHRFDPVAGVWEVADEGILAHRLQRRRVHQAGAVTMIAGGVVAAVGAAIGISGFVEAQGLYDGMVDIHYKEEFLEQGEQYAQRETQMNVGLTMAGVGGAVMVVGIPLSTAGTGKGRSRTQATPEAAAALQLTPGGIGVTGRF